MSLANEIYLKNAHKILKEGVWDTKEIVRPKWADGTSAHTAKIFGWTQVYDLEKEFPIISLRNTNWKGAIDEIIWIWVLKSNNINLLNSHIWDQWADETGSIGKAYGWQLAQKSKYKEGSFDQVDRVHFYLKNQPANRSNLTELFVHKDLHEMGLNPCVHGAQFDVSDGKLNLMLTQRSNDLLAAGSWNVAQYAALIHMFAHVHGLKPGKLLHIVANSHIYDRHVPFIIDMSLSHAEIVTQRLKKLTDKKIEKLILCQKTRKEFIKFKDKILNNPVDMKGELKIAREFELNATDYEAYAKRVVSTKQFLRADFIVNTLEANHEFLTALGFATPRLLLDEKVTDYYAFKSPLVQDKETGKYVLNPESSFNVVDYLPEEEGIKLQARVPVAE